MMTRGRGKKERVVNEPAEVPFKMNAERELVIHYHEVYEGELELMEEKW